jgi:hypothetical protein
MQALFELIHGMAKEEKRLYNLHGRNSRFTQIYKGYLTVTEYNKNLDRDIYQKHFVSFSKAFYSMQKNALLDDILAVLLEYSNSSQDEFNIFKYRAKYEVLNYKGFHDQALDYIQSAIESSEKLGNPKETLRLLEDYRDTLAQSPNADWKAYSKALERIETLESELKSTLTLNTLLQKMDVLIASHHNGTGSALELKQLAQKVKSDIKEIAVAQPSNASNAAAFWSEYRFSKAFEDKFELHRRLVQLEKQAVKENYPREVRLQAVNLLMESSLECGDFLLINGLIYKTEKELDQLTPALRKNFLPKFLELSSIYHFYENDLPLSQKEISELIKLEDSTTEELTRYYFYKIHIQIAATLHRNAAETVTEMLERIPKLDLDPQVKLVELLIAVGLNNREEALVRLQKMRTLLRKSSDGKKWSHLRLFLDMLQKFLAKKSFSIQDLQTIETEWRDLLKLNLWLKSKVEGSFYYNAILSYWHGRKKVLNY